MDSIIGKLSAGSEERNTENDSNIQVEHGVSVQWNGKDEQMGKQTHVFMFDRLV